MSWDIIIFNANKEINLSDPDIENSLVPFDFTKAIEKHFTQIDKQEISVWEITGNGFCFDYYPDNKPVTQIMINMYGEKGLFELIILAKKYGWQIYDSGLDKMLDLNNPSYNGYDRFHAYVQQILNK